MDVSGEMITEIKRKLYSKRSVDIYNACIDIRKKVIKTPRGIGRLVRDQVIPVLLGILKRTSDEQVIHQTINRFARTCKRLNEQFITKFNTCCLSVLLH